MAIRSPKKHQMQYLSETDSAQIHSAALEILRDVGMDIHDEDTRKILKNKGCREADDGFLLFEPELVEDALSTVPDSMVIYDQNGEVAIDTNDDYTHFCPGHNSISTLDYQTGEIRDCTLQDISNTARVCDQLKNFDMVVSLGSPRDVDPEEESVATVKTIVEHTKKPVAFTGHDEDKVYRIWSHLAEVVGGWDQLSEKPIGLDLTGPTSPLKMGDEACQRLRHAASKHLPVVCYPGTMPGLASPMTLAGTLVQSAAEILAGIVIHQLEEPGAPVVTGSAIMPIDMRTGNVIYGSPEYSLANITAVDYFNYIGVPTWTGAGCSDSHNVDAQAGAEAFMSIMSAMNCGTSFAHNVGYLSGGKTGSVEMLVYCDELIGMARRLTADTIVNEDTLAVDVIKRAAKTTDFVAEKHTMKYMKSEMWIPALGERRTENIWKEGGAESLQDRIRGKLNSILG